jgi:putative transposase
MAELFGEVIRAAVHRKEIGEIAHRFWSELPKHNKGVELDEFIVMPNHVHGIVVLCGGHDRPNGPGLRIAHTVDNDVPVSDVACNVAPSDNSNFMSSISPKRGSLGAIIRSYKSAVTDWCHSNRLEDFQWQPRFHDHIIRNKDELRRIRSYIRNNPARWETDRKNPNMIDLWME